MVEVSGNSGELPTTATSDLSAGLGARFEPLLNYLYAKEMGGWGWGTKYNDTQTGSMGDEPAPGVDVLDLSSAAFRELAPLRLGVLHGVAEVVE